MRVCVCVVGNEATFRCAYEARDTLATTLSAVVLRDGGAASRNAKPLHRARLPPKDRAAAGARAGVLEQTRTQSVLLLSLVSLVTRRRSDSLLSPECEL